MPLRVGFKLGIGDNDTAGHLRLVHRDIALCAVVQHYNRIPYQLMQQRKLQRTMAFRRLCSTQQLYIAQEAEPE